MHEQDFQWYVKQIVKAQTDGNLAHAAWLFGRVEAAYGEQWRTAVAVRVNQLND